MGTQEYAHKLSRDSRKTFHIIGKICSTNTDIFLFNIARGEHLDIEQYKILECIKDWAVVDGKYNCQKLYFKKPNVLIVFSNKEPNTNTLSKDRWAILKISNDLTELTDIEGGNLSKKKGNRLDSGCDEESDSQSVWDL